jgi:phosphomannomutase
LRIDRAAGLAGIVVASGAHIGIALDGDADRLIVVDEAGTIIDGDQLMALIGTSWARQGKLTGDGVVATVMSNLGLERYLNAQGLTLERTKRRRPLCPRTHAQRRLQCRRRAIRGISS